MLIKSIPGWGLPERAATPEDVFWRRRSLVKGIAAGSILATAAPLLGACDGAGSETAAEAAVVVTDDPTADLYPVARNTRYAVDRDLTEEKWVTTYNNFYEFGSHKKIWKSVGKFQPRPWEVAIDGMVEKPFKIEADDLIREMPLEERLYRHRCVEAWSMAVPWSGFPLAALVDKARPLASAKYVRMESFFDPDVAPGQHQNWYPWPYVEGLTLDEARNELAFIVTGAYGKPMRKQNGAPLRLAVPWKYGFKHIKSITRFTFAEERPRTFWEEVGPNEYGFWANVNPKVDHARWSQAKERVLGASKKVPTLLYNGYEEFVAHLYDGMNDQKLYM